MRITLSRLAIVVAGLGTACAVEPADDSVSTTSQAVNKLRACFTDLGQPDPSNPNSREFDSGCSTPSPGSFIALRSWDFGDGTGTTTGGTITDHVFPFTNTCYKVHLTVHDNNGKDDDVFHYALFCAVGPCNPVCPP